MKKLVTSIVIVFVVAVLIWLIAAKLFSESATQTASNITEYYIVTLRENIPPLENSRNLSGTDVSMLANMRLMTEELSAKKDTHEMLDALKNLQREVHLFLNGTRNKPIASSSHHHAIKAALGNQGRVRSMIQKYNNLAFVYNERLKSNSLHSKLLDGESQGGELPLLRHDGSDLEIGTASF